MREFLMADKDSEFFSAENAHYSSCGVDTLVSTMETNYLADDISVYLEPCESYPVIEHEPEREPCSNVDEPSIFKTDDVVYPHNNSVVLTESSDLRDSYGKYTGNKVNEVKRSSNRRSSRKGSSNKKRDTKLAAKKSRRGSGKRPVVDLLAANVGRGQRSNLVRPSCPSVWGLAGKIDEIFKKNEENSVNTIGRTSRRGGKRNTDPVNKSIQNSEGEPRALNKGLLVKIKLGKMAIQNCQFNTIPDFEKDPESYREVKLEAPSVPTNIKENYAKEVFRTSNENLDKETVSIKAPINDVHVAERIESSNLDPGTSPDSEVINVIPDIQINGNITEGIRVHSKDSISHQSDDCGVASGIPSPEIVSDVLLCEKQVEGSCPTMPSTSVINSSEEGCPMGPVASFHQTEVRVSTGILTAESLMNADCSVAGIESVESRSNGQHHQKSSKSKSSLNKNITNCHKKASPAKLTASGNVEKSGNQTYCDTDTHPLTGLLFQTFSVLYRYTVHIC